MANDKKLHLFCGFIIGLVGCQYGVPLSIVGGAGKELYDYFHQDKHSVEFADFAFTVCGGAFGNIAYMLLMA